MLKVKEWLLARSSGKFTIIQERNALVKDGIEILPKTIVVVIRVSDGARFTDTSLVKVGGNPYRIREFDYDLQSVRLMWYGEQIICNINQLYY